MATTYFTSSASLSLSLDTKTPVTLAQELDKPLENGNTSPASSASNTSSGGSYSSYEDDVSDVFNLDDQPSSLSSSTNLPMSPADILCSRLIALIQSYSPKTATSKPIRRSVFESTVHKAVELGQPLHFVLPAFPFKSPNRTSKVIGALPDLGEELALARLEALCASIDDIYPGTKLSIVSDGLVYSDILGVPEEDVWNYGTALRKIANERCPHISFARLNQLVSHESEEVKTVEEYVMRSSWYRDQMVTKFLPSDFDVSVELKQNVNALRTYRGYIKFLETDLKDEPTRQGLSKSKVKKMNEIVAKKMIRRGTAFSNAVELAFPDAVRISIHASVSDTKMPISLLVNQEELVMKKGNHTTPWHCAPALRTDGSLLFEHKEVFANSPEYELVLRDGRPSHYRQKSNLFNWSEVEINVEPIYPCGFLISPKGKETASMRTLDMKKIRALAELNSPIVIRGFGETTDRSLFTDKAREMGEVMPWKFGEVLVVKDAGTEGGGLNNVLSAEPMPMHFDGLFKTTKVIGKDGKERVVPQPPNFQFFTVATPAPENSGHTLLASSRILFSLLPAPYNLEALQKMSWSVETTAFDNSKMIDLDLVVPHPTLGTPCLRYHEPWGRDKTAFDPTYVHIENGPQELLQILDDLLYDRRVCYYHKWLAGDLIVSDNISMMHTRDGYKPGSPRELWRIHIN